MVTRMSHQMWVKYSSICSAKARARPSSCCFCSERIDLTIAPQFRIFLGQLLEDHFGTRPELTAPGYRAATEPVSRFPAPGNLELGEVGAIDLGQRRVLGVAQVRMKN